MMAWLRRLFVPPRPITDPMADWPEGRDQKAYHEGTNQRVREALAEVARVERVARARGR